MITIKKSLDEFPLLTYFLYFSQTTITMETHKIWTMLLTMSQSDNLSHSPRLYLSLCLRTELEMMAPLLQGKIWISDMPILNGKIIPYEPDSFNWQLHLRL